MFLDTPGEGNQACFPVGSVQPSQQSSQLPCEPPRREFAGTDAQMVTSFSGINGTGPAACSAVGASGGRQAPHAPLSVRQPPLFPAGLSRLSPPRQGSLGGAPRDSRPRRDFWSSSPAAPFSPSPPPWPLAGDLASQRFPQADSTHALPTRGAGL